jgi:cell division protein FtsZ
MSIDGAKGVLFTIFGGTELSMYDVNEAAKIITSSADEEAKIIFGAGIDERLKDEIKITVVATGFNVKQNYRSGNVSISEPKYTPSVFLEEEIRQEERVKPSAVKQAQMAPVKKAPPVMAPEEEYNDEEEDLGIPAFIRKKMK